MHGCVQLAPFAKSPLRGSPLLRSYFCSFLGALLMHPRWLLFVRALKSALMDAMAELVSKNVQ